MSSRIVVFPVMGRRWAFTAVLPTGVPQGGPANSPLVWSWRVLLKTLHESPSTSERADIFTSFAADKMHEQWVALGEAPKGSIRKRLHLIGQRLLSKLGPTESFLKAIPKDAGLVEIVYPNYEADVSNPFTILALGCSSVNPRLVRRRVRHLASSGEVIHRKYMYGACALLPFSVCLGILPLPNFVLAWNLFRVYSHWRAIQGSRRLHYLVTDSHGEMSSSSQPREATPIADTSKIASTGTSSCEELRKEDLSKRWVFMPSEILAALLVPINVPNEPISDVTVEEICKEYSVDPHEILKWRNHRLPIKSFG